MKYFDLALIWTDCSLNEMSTKFTRLLTLWWFGPTFRPAIVIHSHSEYMVGSLDVEDITGIWISVTEEGRWRNYSQTEWQRDEGGNIVFSPK